MNNQNISFTNTNSNEKEKKETLNLFKRKREVKKSMILNMKREEIISNDKKAENIIDNIISEKNIALNEIINIPISEKYPFDGYLFSYIIQKQFKSEKDLYFLIHFLKFYDAFNDLLKKMYNIEEKIFLFNQIINKIIIETKEENDILYKTGEISEKFYFLLKGSVIRLNVRQYEVNMNKFEYFLYMKYLYKLDENKLLNLILKENEEVFDKYELLYFILGDKSIKYSGEYLKQIRNMEESYVTQRLIPNEMLEMNYNNDKKIVLFETEKTLDDVLKGDYVISLTEGNIKKINVGIKDYLENLNPIEFEGGNDDLIKNNVTLFTYDIDKEINVGEHLEELDSKKIQKRNSTIICNKDCIFGVIIKKDYISCLKITQTKFHKNDINFLISNELFSMMNFREFDNNYYHLFEYKKLHEKHSLFEQGEISNKIFFLKKGEICVTFEGSFNDIYRIISLKGGPKNRKSLDINYIKRFHSINLDENIFRQKHKFTIFKIKENFPIGLNDFLDEENDFKILFNAYCIMDSEVFMISKENFDEILFRENEVRKIEKNYVIKRKKILIDELNALKNGLIQNYISEKFNIKLELPYLFDDSPLLSKSKSNKKSYLTKLTKPKKKKFNQLKLDTKMNGELLIEMSKAIRTKMEKENIENQKYKYLNSENNKTFRSIFDNNNLILKSNSTYRTNDNNKIRNIKDLSVSNKFNNDILKLMINDNDKNTINFRKRNEKIIIDPYDKIYNTLKNDEKNKNTDFSYLNLLWPPHPNKQISKSNRNIFNKKLHKLNFINKSLTKLDNELYKNENVECNKNLISSMKIIAKNKDINKKQKIVNDEFQLIKFLKVNDKLNQIFEKVNIENNSSNLNKKEKINGVPVVFPKIIK